MSEFKFSLLEFKFSGMVPPGLTVELAAEALITNERDEYVHWLPRRIVFTESDPHFLITDIRCKGRSQISEHRGTPTEVFDGLEVLMDPVLARNELVIVVCNTDTVEHQLSATIHAEELSHGHD